MEFTVYVEGIGAKTGIQLPKVYRFVNVPTSWNYEELRAGSIQQLEKDAGQPMRLTRFFVKEFGDHFRDLPVTEVDWSEVWKNNE